jgi:D-alanyl-lipoteichoic acid acyltransferase DltB (MBOAT superfamily)
LPQLAGVPRYNPEEGSEGLFLMAVGLVKKVAIGDYVALNLVDRVFDAPTQYSALECYAGVLGYAVQIYCDFSGYTDIAIGAALLLGIRMPLNFNAPYKAPEIIDFWRRWHISLSSWLRDYLYISLGGNRRGRGRTYFNLMTTMLLGGLWHGAGWTFVVWGGLHGWALSVTRMVGESRSRTTRAIALLTPALAAGPILGGVMCALSWTYEWSLFRAFLLVGWVLGAALAVGALHHDWASRNRAASRSANPLYDERRDLKIPGMPRTLRGQLFTIAAAFATFHVVCAGWIFFRAQTFQAAAAYFTQLLTLTSYHPNLHWKVVVVLLVGLFSHWIPESLYMRSRELFIRLPAPAQGVALLAAALALREMASAEAVPFVYFQF